MGPLLGLVLPLAFGAAVSPTLLAVQLVTLSRRTGRWPVPGRSRREPALVLAGFSIGALLLAKSTSGPTAVRRPARS